VFDVLIVASGLMDKTTGSGLGVQESVKQGLLALVMLWGEVNVRQLDGYRSQIKWQAAVHRNLIESQYKALLSKSL
jgi:hypothetical protein